MRGFHQGQRQKRLTKGRIYGRNILFVRLTFFLASRGEPYMTPVIMTPVIRVAGDYRGGGSVWCRASGETPDIVSCQRSAGRVFNITAQYGGVDGAGR